MAEEKLFEGQIKKYFHSVGIYPAGFPSDRMKVEMVGWYTKIWGGGSPKSGWETRFLWVCVHEKAG